MKELGRTFKYHMTLRKGEGVCSNRPRAVMWGGEVWSNRHITL